VAAISNAEVDSDERLQHGRPAALAAPTAVCLLRHLELGQALVERLVHAPVQFVVFGQQRQHPRQILSGHRRVDVSTQLGLRLRYLNVRDERPVRRRLLHRRQQILQPFPHMRLVIAADRRMPGSQQGE
jgi:hypothetical protein